MITQNPQFVSFFCDSALAGNIDGEGVTNSSS
jgi:hypothetical protein